MVFDRWACTFHPLLVGGDGRALDADVVALNGMGGFDGNTIVSRVTILQAQVVVFAVNIDVGKHELEKENTRR